MFQNVNSVVIQEFNVSLIIFYIVNTSKTVHKVTPCYADTRYVRSDFNWYMYHTYLIIMNCNRKSFKSKNNAILKGDFLGVRLEVLVWIMYNGIL